MVMKTFCFYLLISFSDNSVYCVSFQRSLNPLFLKRIVVIIKKSANREKL